MTGQEAQTPVVEPSLEDQQKSRAKIVPFTIVVVLALVAVLVWRLFFASPSISPNIVVLSGRIEGDDSAIASKITGKILETRVREGDEVKAGDILAVLDDRQIEARKEQSEAALIAAEAKTDSARAQISVLQEQLNQNRLAETQSKEDAEGRVSQAEATLAATEADLARQEASYKLALFDKQAYTSLARTGAVSERQGKQSESTADQSAATVAAARRMVEASKAALDTARANLTTPGIRESQVAAVRHQILEQQAQIAADVASATQERFQLAEAEANRQDLIIRAPFSGTVITRAVEPGEVVTAGTVIVTLLDLNKIYLRGFVPEGEIGKVKVGQPAHVYLDSNPNKALDAYVSRIDPQAIFTPENTYFRDDRVKQVVGLKLQLRDGLGFAKPGMPSDGEVLVLGDVWPQQKSIK